MELQLLFSTSLQTIYLFIYLLTYFLSLSQMYLLAGHPDFPDPADLTESGDPESGQDALEPFQQMMLSGLAPLLVGGKAGGEGAGENHAKKPTISLSIPFQIVISFLSQIAEIRYIDSFLSHHTYHVHGHDLYYIVTNYSRHP